ncbi:MAG: hypothetical protein ACLPVF_14605 [Acidimicrobiales bacterium]
MAGREIPGPRLLIALAVAGLAAAVAASFTHPFTPGADVVTAIPLGIAVVVLARRRHADGRPALDPHPAPPATGSVPAHRWASVWLALATAIVGWELYCYLSAPRSAHPTLSVLINMLEATPTGKALAFFLWLALGWYLVVP